MKSLLCANQRSCNIRSWTLMSRWDVRNHPHTLSGRQRNVLVFAVGKIVWVGVCVRAHKHLLH